MTQQQHLITPPLALIEGWVSDFFGAPLTPGEGSIDLATRAAQWGADQELEACCEYLVRCAQWESEDVDELRAARRPKPPSLKKQALEALRHAPGPDYPNPITLLTADEHALIRRALEALPD